MKTTRWICAAAVIMMAPLLVPALLVALGMAVVVLAAWAYVVATAMGVVLLAVFGVVLHGIFMFFLSPTAIAAAATYMLWRHFRRPAAPVEVGCR
jgi:hypothetical protein